MNAAVCAVVHEAAARCVEVLGVRRGFAGLIEGDLIRLKGADVREKMQYGGTFLGTARSEEFKSGEAQSRARDGLAARGVDGLVVIGGNGSQRGAHALSRLGFPVVGVASTVDNDLYGSDISIGVDTALNTIIEAIDRLKTTAESHHRAFLVEVMGRDCGYLAVMAGISAAAEVVVTPEYDLEPAEVAEGLRSAHEHGKGYALAIVTDGARNNAEVISRYFREHATEVGFELRTTVLGHVQRGGAPTPFDRFLATNLGMSAVGLLCSGESGRLVGWVNGGIAYAPLEEVASRAKELDPGLDEMRRKMAG
jgi:6-phosphofructokinase 1